MESTLAISMLRSIFDNDESRIVSKRGWKILHEEDDALNQETMAKQTYRIKIETRCNGDVWYIPQVRFSTKWVFGLVTVSTSWKSIRKSPHGGYDYGDSLIVSYRNEEDAIATVEGFKAYRAKQLGEDIEKIDYKYL